MIPILHLDQNGVAHEVPITPLRSLDSLPENVRHEYQSWTAPPAPSTPQEQEQGLRAILELAVETYPETSQGRDFKRPKSFQADMHFGLALIIWIRKTGGLPSLDQQVRSKFPEWLLVEVNKYGALLPLATEQAVSVVAALEKVRAEHP